MNIDFSNCESMDRNDALANFKEYFYLPKGKIYLDGNSLGALPKATLPRVQRLVLQEWGDDLIESWGKNAWMELPISVGNKVAKLIGADENEVVATDSTSVNLFKALHCALQVNSKRNIILTLKNEFPTDLYIAQGIKELNPEKCYEIISVDSESEMLSQLSDKVAVIYLSQVNYRSGKIIDMKKMTAAAHQHAALVVWDLSHSAGAIEVAVNECQVDFAVGCGYKYLNGGPGAPAYLFVAKRHHDKIHNPIAGWIGHATPFAFSENYQPAVDIRRMQCGTPAVMSLAALEVGVDIALQAEMRLVRQKSLQLSHLFMSLIEQECSSHFQILTAKEDSQRGSQVSLLHPQAKIITEKLIQRGVVPDFRPENIIRFGFTPLYLSFTDIWYAVQMIKEVTA